MSHDIDIQAEVAASQAEMLQMDLSVVTLTHDVPLAAMHALLDEHHDYVAGLERDGHLLASGPVVEPDGSVAGTSMWILRAAPEEAAAMAAADPLCVAGMRSFDVRRWRLNMGFLGLEVRLSNGSARLS